MTPIPPALAYRRAATQQASVVGLVIALYDTLAGDLRRGIAAMCQKNIEDRTNQLKHGFSVLTQLDSLIDIERGGQTAINLRCFYGHIRQEMLRAQFTQDPSILERASALLLDVRGAWQEVDMRSDAGEVNAKAKVSNELFTEALTSFNCLA
jgi:flagellar protein FliS